MYNKYWKSLIVSWCKDYKKRGLTIPFIIGSQSYLTKSVQAQDIKSLIYDIVEDGEYEIFITHCIDLNARILCLRDESKKNIKGFHPLYEKGKQSNFFRTISIKENETVEEIIEELVDDYQNDIENGEFSFKQFVKDEKCKFAYNSDDETFIKSCFAKIND